MVGIRKLEHVDLYTREIEPSVQFYTEVLGLVEVERDRNTVYLSSGYTNGYDLALTQGGTGVDYFSVRINPDIGIDEYESRLAECDVDTTRHEGYEHEVGGVQFDLPSGVTMEVVQLKDKAAHFRKSGRRLADSPGTGPIDIDHINLMSTVPEEDVEFLESVLDFKLSEVGRDSPDGWRNAFTRYGDYHHDVGVSKTTDPQLTLHHVAWRVIDISHLRNLLDRIAQSGRSIESGVNRHYIADNIFSYVRDPSDNRVELTTEMATLDDNTPTVYNDPDQNTFSVWGGITRPESFKEGT